MSSLKSQCLSAAQRQKVPNLIPTADSLDLTWQPGAKPVLQDLGQELRARKGSTKLYTFSKYNIYYGIILKKDLHK